MRTYSVGILVQVSPGSRSEPGNLPTGQGRWRPQQTLHRHRQSTGSQEQALNLARCRGHQMESREQRLGLQLSLVKWEGPTCNSERRNNHTNVTVIVFWLCRSFRTASSGLGRPPASRNTNKMLLSSGGLVFCLLLFSIQLYSSWGHGCFWSTEVKREPLVRGISHPLSHSETLEWKSPNRRYQNDIWRPLQETAWVPKQLTELTFRRQYFLLLDMAN